MKLNNKNDFYFVVNIFLPHTLSRYFVNMQSCWVPPMKTILIKVMFCCFHWESPWLEIAKYIFWMSSHIFDWAINHSVNWHGHNSACSINIRTVWTILMKTNWFQKLTIRKWSDIQCNSKISVEICPLFITDSQRL